MSTVGHRRPPALRPRPARGLIAALVISSVCVLLTLGAFLLSGGVLGFGLSLLMAVAPLPLLLAGVLALDRLEPEPGLNLAYAFAWGGGVAVVLTLVIHGLGEAAVLHAGVGRRAADQLGAVVFAPVIEEALKGLVLVPLLLRRRREIHGLTDGVIYASMSALGFAAVENVGYYLMVYSEEGVGGAVGLFVVRGLIAPLGHPIYTSLIGLGVAYAATRRGAFRFAAIPLGYLGAITLHGLWNAMATFGGLPGLAVAYLVIMLVLVALIAVTVRERRSLAARVRPYLSKYVHTGLVTPQDLDMLASLPARRAARKWAGARGLGRAMGEYQQAATELVMLHERADREGMDPGAFAAERDALLGMMAAVRRW
ncbi:PrsW family intramembrane metalloprotease [Thermoactinospora rubra]|uniref:PrsW family intramembrane metalloprotease n=1 Tax=Thermoactinospora rubra TaxID=1088767 RepID=UPI000A0FEB9C|nr:PrsW family intramembrane metalloprotease [Thermoactinospora rubra]